MPSSHVNMVLHLVLLITPIVIYLVTLAIKFFIKYLLSKQEPVFQRELNREDRQVNIVIKEKDDDSDQLPVNLLIPVHRISKDDGYKPSQSTICDCRML